MSREPPTTPPPAPPPHSPLPPRRGHRDASATLPQPAPSTPPVPMSSGGGGGGGGGGPHSSRSSSSSPWPQGGGPGGPWDGGGGGRREEEDDDFSPPDTRMPSTPAAAEATPPARERERGDVIGDAPIDPLDSSQYVTTNGYIYTIGQDNNGKRRIGVDKLPSTPEGKRELAANMVARALAENLKKPITISFQDPEMTAAVAAYCQLAGVEYTAIHTSPGAKFFNSKNPEGGFEALLARERNAVIAREAGAVSGEPQAAVAKQNFTQRFFRGYPPDGPHRMAQIEAAERCRIPEHGFWHNLAAMLRGQPFNAKKRINQRVAQYHATVAGVAGDSTASPTPVLQGMATRGAVFALGKGTNDEQRLEHAMQSRFITVVGKTASPASFVADALKAKASAPPPPLPPQAAAGSGGAGGPAAIPPSRPITNPAVVPRMGGNPPGGAGTAAHAATLVAQHRAQDSAAGPLQDHRTVIPDGRRSGPLPGGGSTIR